MQALQNNRILPGISSFAWNKDCSKIAICPNNQEIWIFKTNNTADVSKWERIQVLKEHFNPVSSLDWHKQTNLLLSSSTDRGVIIWEESAQVGGLKPKLAVIKETKSNIDASWNHKGNKFCVAASSGNVFIGKFSAANDFWVALTISGKKPLHKSSVVSVRFDPQSGRVCASASTDGQCFITTCYDKDTDAASTAGPFGSVSSWGETLLSFTSIGWVNFVNFSPDASTICYATHDCELNFVDVSKAAQKVKEKPEKVFYKGNPFLNGIFLNENTFIACGFDKIPFLFKKNGSQWTFVKHLDEGANQVREAQIAKGSFEKSQVFFKKSEQESATSMKLDDDVIMKEMNTKHSNYINQLKVYAATGNKIQVLSTSDINGYINYWDVSQF